MSFDEYFDRKSGTFASFYRSELFARLLGRGPLFDRLRFAVGKALELEAKRVLDVGCGSGPLFAPLASRGIRVTGLDPAPAMVAMARSSAAPFSDIVEVRAHGWEDLDEQDTHDLAVALGVFDYIDRPIELLHSMQMAAPNIVASFPRPCVRTVLRKLRYAVRGVKVHGYPRDRLAALAAASGLVINELRPLGRAGYAVLFGRASVTEHAAPVPEQG